MEGLQLRRGGEWRWPRSSWLLCHVSRGFTTAMYTTCTPTLQTKFVCTQAHHRRHPHGATPPCILGAGELGNGWKRLGGIAAIPLPRAPCSSSNTVSSHPRHDVLCNNVAHHVAAAAAAADEAECLTTALQPSPTPPPSPIRAPARGSTDQPTSAIGRRRVRAE